MSLPGIDLIDNAGAGVLDSLVQQLEDNLIIADGVPDSFSTDTFLSEFLMTFETLFGSPADSTQTQCIVRVISEHVNGIVLDSIATNLQVIRQAFTTSSRILNFLLNFNMTLGGFEPLPECVDTIVQFSFCGRCTDSIPPLCTNVCGAIIRSCFAGFYTGVGDVLRQRLWDIARQIIRIADDSLANVHNMESQIIDSALQLVRVIIV